MCALGKREKVADLIALCGCLEVTLMVQIRV